MGDRLGDGWALCRQHRLLFMDLDGRREHRLRPYSFAEFIPLN